VSLKELFNKIRNNKDKRKEALDKLTDEFNKAEKDKDCERMDECLRCSAKLLK
jgi:hypothetical protein